MFIQDSVHGYIELKDLEEDLISTEEFQRLRRVRQLGFTSLVYPSTTHTRFEHSLGAMYLIKRFSKHLGVSGDDRKHLRAAALLHDLGHGPHSHTSEEVMDSHGYSHEEFSCKKVKNSQVREVLERHGLDPEKVVELIKGKTEFGQIVAGDIDVDRMDYLMRDSYYSGVAHGTIDEDTIIRASKLREEEVVFRSKFKQSIEGLLTARHFMIPTLYEHNAVVRAEKMMERAIETLVGSGEISVEDLAEMDDVDMRSTLRNTGNERASYLNKKLDSRDIFKTALSWDKSRIGKEGLKQLSSNIGSETDLERKIAEEAGVEEKDVLVDSPHIPRKKDIKIKMLKNGDIVKLGEISPLTRAIHESKWEQVAVEVYSPEEKLSEVEEAAKSVLREQKDILKNFL
ncbi:MAG: HD domain-containing protein [Candidatus Nanohaloarchaea archaeon]|nr:HD domain-containing protein [Candidatus Nanohaloarchaea archaeon]